MKTAREIWEEGSIPEAISLADLRRKLSVIGEGPPARSKPKALSVSKDLHPFTGSSRNEIEARYARYLKRRGFKTPVAIAKAYDLRYATTGRMKGRLVFLCRDGKDVRGWTGRAISQRGSLARYKTFPEDGTGRDLLWNADRCEDGGRMLLFVEGPIDALKVDLAGRPLGIRSVALLGLSMGEGKVAKVFELADLFDRVGFMLDPGAFSKALELGSLVSQIYAEVIRLPGSRDPGAMGIEPLRRFLSKI